MHVRRAAGDDYHVKMLENACDPCRAAHNGLLARSSPVGPRAAYENCRNCNEYGRYVCLAPHFAFTSCWSRF
jgi:hypothetical protein